MLNQSQIVNKITSYATGKNLIAQFAHVCPSVTYNNKLLLLYVIINYTEPLFRV